MPKHPVRPNILWLMTDEQRVDTMGAYGAHWARTPNLDRLADEGVRFDAAYTPSPICVAARASILTGKAASSIGMLSNHHLLTLDNPRFLTWQCAAAGYQVASFGKHHYACTRKAFDLEGGVHISPLVHPCHYEVEVDTDTFGVVRYEQGTMWKWLFAGRFPGTIDDTPEMQNVNAALNWLKQRDPNRPFMLRVSVLAPHTPVVTPEPYDTLIDPESIDIPLDFPGTVEGLPDYVAEHLQKHAGSHLLTREQIMRSRQCYYGYMACADRCFGRLIDAMRELGQLDNTIIAFVSDHGCHLADHGFYQKQSFYDASARVPFFFTGPGVAQGTAVRTPVNIGSLLPTLMDLAGVPAADHAEFPSLADALADGREPTAAPVFSEIDFGVWGGYREGDRYVMVRDQDWKMGLFRDPGNPRRLPETDGLMLHNLNDDPAERCNLAAELSTLPVRRRLLETIDTWDAARTIRTPSCNPRAKRGNQP